MSNYSCHQQFSPTIQPKTTLLEHELIHLALWDSRKQRLLLGMPEEADPLGQMGHCIMDLILHSSNLHLPDFLFTTSPGVALPVEFHNCLSPCVALLELSREENRLALIFIGSDSTYCWSPCQFQWATTMTGDNPLGIEEDCYVPSSSLCQAKYGCLSSPPPPDTMVRICFVLVSWQPR